MVDTRPSVDLHRGVIPGWSDFSGDWFGLPVEFWCHIVGYRAVEED